MLSGIHHKPDTVFWHTIDQDRLHRCIGGVKRCLLRIGDLHETILRQLCSVLTKFDRIVR